MIGINFILKLIYCISTGNEFESPIFTRTRSEGAYSSEHFCLNAENTPKMFGNNYEFVAFVVFA